MVAVKNKETKLNNAKVLYTVCTQKVNNNNSSLLDRLAIKPLPNIRPNCSRQAVINAAGPQRCFDAVEGRVLKIFHFCFCV